MEIKDWLVEYGGVENGYFKRNFYTTIEEAENGVLDKYIQKLNNTDVYKTIYAYQTEDVATSLLVAPLIFDLDKEIKNEGDFKQIVRDTMLVLIYLEEELFIPKSQMELYFSGSKGFHIEIPFEVIGLEPSRLLAEQYKLIAQEVNRETIYKTVDMKIYEKRRLFRLANTINSKTGLYKVQVPIDMLHELTYESIQKYANAPQKVTKAEAVPNPKAKSAVTKILLKEKFRALKRKYPKTIVPVEKKDLLPCVQKILNEGIAQGGRNNTCVAIGSSLAQSGVDMQEAFDIVLSWNELNEPPMPEYEVRRTVESAYQMAHSGRGYGCAFFKENDYCIGSECKLY